MASGINVIRSLFSSLGPIFPNIAANIGVNLFYSPRRFKPHAVEKKIEQTCKTSFFDSSQGKLKVYHWQGERKENVLLVHGWEGRATQLYKFVQPLLDEGYSVLAFDGPAHGASEGKKTTLPLFAKTIEDIYKAFDISHVIAHSFGAGATAIAISNGLVFNKAVLISPPYSVENVVNRFAEFIRIPGEVSKRMHTLMENDKWHGKSRECFSFSTLGKNITTPLFIVHDKTDKYVLYEDGCKVHESCKNSIFMSTDGYGHNAVIRNDDVVRKSVDFLLAKNIDSQLQYSTLKK